MQILPANDIFNNLPVSGGSDTGANVGDLFAEILGVQSGVSAKQELQQSYEDYAQELEDKAADLQERHVSESVGQTGSELVSAEDFTEVRNRLEAMGVPPQDLDELQGRVEEGMTWKDMANALERLAVDAGDQSVSLTAQDRAELTNMLKKMGFHPSQAAALVYSLARGESAAVLKAIKKRLDALPADAKLQLSASEMNTLGKALKLSAQGASTLRAFANGLGQQGVAAQDVRSLMTMLAQEVDGGLNVAERLQSMQELMSDMMDKVKEKALGAAKADRLGQDDAGKWLHANKEDWTAEAAKESLHKEAKKEDGDESAEDALKDMLKDLKLKHGVADPKAEREAMGLLADRAPNQVKADTAVQPGKTADLSQFKNSVLDAQTRQAVFQQVKSAVLTNLKGEVQQMSLQLQPENLGAVQVTLVARESDVAGVIRADSPEAAKAIADNLNELKAALHKEGVRVNSLEVETRTADQGGNFGNQWSSPDGHNFMRDMQQRARSLRLAALRNTTGTNIQAPAAEPAPSLELLADGRVSLIA